MRITVPLLLAIFLASCVSVPPPLKRDPTRILVDEIEAAITLPSGAGELQKYSRYYAESDSDGGRYLLGIFILSGADEVHIVPIEKLPRTLDGGCGVIRFKYNVNRKQTVSLFCSGVG